MKHFSGHRFDEHRPALWRGTKEIRLTRKAAAVLLCLIERAGRTVARDTILSTVWSGTHVHADNVKVLVHEIRTALEDDPREPNFIRSEPGGGYTFIAPLHDGVLPALTHRAGATPAIAADPHILFRLAVALADPAQSDCRVFLVDGERGMGKSALCAEFMRRAREVASARVCYGQAVAHSGISEPYLPFVDALHHLARQSPRSVPALLAQHAPTWLARLPAWVTDVAPVKGSVAPPDPFRMIREFGDLLEALADEGPTVMVLDDLQWADLETEELLRALSRRHAPLRTVVLASYTPFATTLAAAALRNLSAELRATTRSSSMPIVPLTEDQVRAYLVERFASDSVGRLARVVHRVSSGNPLVMVSMMDALIAAGSVVFESDGWRVRHAPRTIERSLPATVLDALLWRFDQLEADDRVVLECAAAVGSEFCAVDVSRAAGAESPMPILRRIETLCERGFIARRTRNARRVPSAMEVYRFIHPLHAQVLAGHAPVFDQLRAAERLAFDRRPSTERFG
ncbi:MAG TPA: AAA family ATPase [Vicinamibacterales bacterium]|nr:AAA family ATPase [Vicinamibacterales bacterium]